MIEPLQSDATLLADIRSATADPRHLHLWWLGQSGFLLAHAGRHLLFDPYLSDSLTTKYAKTDKPHVRMTRRVISPVRLDFLDVITSTHLHTDHLDPDTLAPLVAANPKLLLAAPAAHVTAALTRSGIAPTQIVPFGHGTAAAVGPFPFTAVPAAHPDLAADDQGRPLYLGYVVRIGPLTVYHSGDTVVYPGMADLLRPHNIDLAILPINGKVGNMGGTDAARLAKAINAKLVIPCHYEMFEFNTADPQTEFVPECDRLGQRYKLLRAGERLTLTREDLT